MRSAAAELCAALPAGCAVTAFLPSTSSVAAFSGNRPGADAPRHREPLVITRAKAPTRYRPVDDEQVRSVVVHARAERSATGLTPTLDIDPAAQPRVAWRWRVLDLIAGSGGDRLGQCKPFERGYVADFGERPGRLIGIGIMTDTDSADGEAEAFDGDIELRGAS